MKKYLLLLLLTGSIVMIIVMAKTGASLKTVATPKGILDLEFAYNSTKATAVITAWQPATGDHNNIKTANINTYLDFIFLFFYSLFLYFTCKKIGRITAGAWGKAGILFAQGALLAGILDILENAGMLRTLSGNIDDLIALSTTICSVIKWVLALLAVVYCVAGATVVINKGKIRSLLA
jgi:hypothetical protein